MPRLSPEQIDLRKTGIGASEIAAIAGVSQWRDAFDVLNAKLGYEEEGGDSEAAEWGHRLESVVRAWYVSTMHTADEPAPALSPCGTLVHPKHPWALATLDSKIVGTRRGLEIKVVGARMIYDWDAGSDDGIPNEVRCQCEWQMFVCDLDEIDVAALLGGTQARVWRIKSDPELRARLATLGEKWWRDHVLERKAPELTASDGVRAYLNGRYPPPPAPVVVPADADVTEAIKVRALAIKQRDEGESMQRKATAEIIAWLGQHNATDVLADEYEFRFRVRKDGTRQPWCRKNGEK